MYPCGRCDGNGNWVVSIHFSNFSRGSPNRKFKSPHQKTASKFCVTSRFLLRKCRFFGRSSEWMMRFTSLTRSLTFCWCAVKWDVTNSMDVPNKQNDMATAPFVRKAVPGRTDRQSSSGTEQNHIKSRRMKTARWIVPRLVECNITCDGPSVSCSITSHSKRSEHDSCVPITIKSGTCSMLAGRTKSFICLRNDQ